MDDDVNRLDTLLVTLDGAVTADKRVHALQSLQSFIAHSTELDQTDQLTASLKNQLKNQNHLVSSLALSIIPVYATKLASSSHTHRAHDVKSLLHAILTSVLERLGDQREKTREGARVASVEMARAAYLVSVMSAKDTQSAAASFEKLFKEAGLGAKSAKVKEQATLALITLKKAIEKLPLKPFLPSLVEHLSDADPGVREAARTGCISLFASATPTAKSELKKEMEKKGVRKQTIDAILAQVLGVGVEADGGGVEAKASAGPVADMGPSLLRDGPTARSASLMGHAEVGADDGVSPVYAASQWDVDRTMTACLPCFAEKETEHNWLAREQSIIKLRGLLRTGAHDQFPDAFQTGLKQLQEGILKATTSLRTTLSIHALQLVSELAQKMKEGLDPFADVFLASLVKMAGYTKKIVAGASQTAVHDILVHVSYRHKFLDLIWQHLQEKTVTTRAFMCGHLVTILNTHGAHRKHAIEGHGGLEIVERMCKRALADQNIDVREKAREAFFKVEVIWPALAAQILDGLDAATKKQIQSNRGRGVAGTTTAAATARAVQAGAAGPGPATAGRKSTGPGPSSAIVAAKRAAAARLAQERKRQEEAEAAEAAAEQEEAAASPLSSRHSKGEQEEKGRRAREAEVEAEAGSSVQLMDEVEDKGEREAVPKPARLSFPPLPTPKSPLRASASGHSNGQGHSRTPSSIPLPVSPRLTNSNRTTPQLRDVADHRHSKASLTLSSSPTNGQAATEGSRSRTTSLSSSSSSSIRSGGRLGSTGSPGATARFDSFGQRVAQPFASSLSTPRVRTISSSSGSLRDRIAESPSSRRGTQTSTSSSNRSLGHLAPASQEQEETVELDQFPDASMDLMSSSTDFNFRGRSSSPPVMPSSKPVGESGSGLPFGLNSPPPNAASTIQSTPTSTKPPSSASTERSRLPRPVSVMYPSASPMHVDRSGHAHSRSIDATLPASPSVAPSPRTHPIPPTRSPAPAPTKEEEAAAERAKSFSTSSLGVKWFLGKASRLERDGSTGLIDADIDVHLSPVKKRPESEVYISQLQSGQADVRTFKGLASICKEFRLPERSVDGREEGESSEGEELRPGKGMGLQSALGLIHLDSSRREQEIAVTMWQQGNLFERLFASLVSFLLSDSDGSAKDLKTAGMIVLHRLVDNQFKLFEVLGKERELVELVVELVKSNKAMNVRSACQAILESWSLQTNVVVGISTIRGLLAKYIGDDATLSTPSLPSAHTISIHTLSLRCLSRLFQRLPVELVEEEVERCRTLLQKGLNHWNIETRQQAVAVLVAANGKVNDPKSLFTILQPMERAQEDLLMYYMSRA